MRKISLVVRRYHILLQLLDVCYSSHSCDDELKCANDRLRVWIQFDVLYSVGKEGVGWPDHRDLTWRGTCSSATP